MKNLLTVLQHSTPHIGPKMRREAIRDDTCPCQLSTRRQREARPSVPAPPQPRVGSSMQRPAIKPATPRAGDWASKGTSPPGLTEYQESQQKSARALPQPLADGHTVEPSPARARDGNAVDRPPASGRPREVLPGRAPLGRVTGTRAFLQVTALCLAASKAQAAVPEQPVGHRHTP